MSVGASATRWRPHLEAIARSFEARLEYIAAETERRSRQELDSESMLQSPEGWEQVRSSTRECRRWQAAHLREGRIPRGELDLAPHVEGARYAAEAGVSIDWVLRSFRVGDAVAWQEWIRAVEEQDLGAAERRLLLRWVLDYIGAYDNQVAQAVAAAHRRARRAAATRRDLDLYLRLRQLVEGTGEEQPPGYALDAHHVGAIVWGGDAEPCIASLADALGTRSLVRCSAFGDLVWVWMSARTSLVSLGRQLAQLRLPEGTRVALGGPAYGLEGFRLTHEEAGTAFRVADRTGAARLYYRDCVVEGIALAAEDEARRLVERELGGLASPGERAAELRRTLRAYFAASQNATAAAAALRVSDRTVSRRLDAVAEQLGEHPDRRSAELQIALRAMSVLDVGPAGA